MCGVGGGGLWPRCGCKTRQYGDWRSQERQNRRTQVDRLLGAKDDITQKYLAKTYEAKLGKASVTGYCIRFKALKDINIDTLEAAIRYGLAAQNEIGDPMK